MNHPMREEGPESWKTTDPHFRRPEHFPHYHAPLTPAPPQGFPVASATGNKNGATAGSPPHGQAAPETLGLATVKGIAARFSLTTGLLAGGLAVAALAMFLPWTTVSAHTPFGGSAYQVDASPLKGGWLFLVLLVIAGAAWLAWPTVTRSPMPTKRLVGLSGMVFVLIGFFLVGLFNYANGVAEKQKAMADAGESLGALGGGVDISIGFGLILYTAAVAAIVFGAARIWIQRVSKGHRSS